MPSTSSSPSSSGAVLEPGLDAWSDALEQAKNSRLPAPATKLLGQVDLVLSLLDPTADHDARLVANSTRDLLRSFHILPEKQFRELMTELNRLRDHDHDVRPLWDQADALDARRKHNDSLGDRSLHKVANAHIAAELTQVREQMKQHGSPNLHGMLERLSEKWASCPEALLTLGSIQNVFLTAYSPASRASDRYARGERVPDGDLAEQLAVLIRISRNTGIPIRNAQLQVGIEPDFPSDHRISLYSGSLRGVPSEAQAAAQQRHEIRIEISVPKGADEMRRRTIGYYGTDSEGQLERSSGVLTPGASLMFGRALHIRSLFGGALPLVEPIAVEPEILTTGTSASRAALRISWLADSDRILVEDLGGRKSWGFSHGREDRGFTRGMFNPGQPSKPGGPVGPDGFTEFF